MIINFIRKYPFLLPLFVLLQGFIILIYAGINFGDNFFTIKNGMKVSGSLIRYERKTLPNPMRAGRWAVYLPVVRFSDGVNSYEYEYSFATGSKHISENSQVTVYFEVSNPKKYVIDNFYYAYLESIVLVIFGLAFSFIGIVGVVTRTKHAHNKSLKDAP